MAFRVIPGNFSRTCPCKLLGQGQVARRSRNVSPDSIEVYF